jgi:nucleoside phosphorylase
MEVDFKEQGRTYGKASQDRNAYTMGVLGGRAVVLAYPRDMGTLNAATVASDIRYSFWNIKIGLVVGVAGGAPQTSDGTDIHLGDVIISTAVIQYDFGRQYPDGFRRKN